MHDSQVSGDFAERPSVWVDGTPNGEMVVRFAGPLDMVALPFFRIAMEVAERWAGVRGRVVVHLAHVTSIDTRGLGELLTVHRRMGDAFAIADPAPVVRRVLSAADVPEAPRVVRLEG